MAVRKMVVLEEDAKHHLLNKLNLHDRWLTYYSTVVTTFAIQSVDDVKETVY